MNKNIKVKIDKIPTKILSQLLFQSIMIISVSLISFLFMTWVVTDLFNVTHTYEAALYELIGTLVILVMTVAPLNVVLYRKREKEVLTLSEAIKRVADGDFQSRIKIDENSAISSIYESFNKMCCELESIKILRNDFINNYSHEFKTPISSINGFASLLLEREIPEKEKIEYIKIIVEESDRLSKLAKNSILLSKLSNQYIVSDNEKYDIGEQLRQCSILLSKKWLDKKIEFNGQFNSVCFYGNKEILQHLWINILDNAIKYTPCGGEISFCNYLDEENIIVEITDNGIGMDNDTIKHLFDPYYQKNNTSLDNNIGIGLGLAISKRIVELYEGEIIVKSKPTEGSTFTIKLPIKDK